MFSVPYVDIVLKIYIFPNKKEAFYFILIVPQNCTIQY